MDHILGHKTNLDKFKTTEIISSIFNDHNGMKLEINHRKKMRKKLTKWRQKKKNATKKQMGPYGN